MNQKTIAKSNVDLIEVFQIEENGLLILSIVDFGHGMGSDLRIIPKSKLAEILKNINDKNYCEKLARNRHIFKPLKLK